MKYKNGSITCCENLKPLGIAYMTIDGSFGVVDFDCIGFPSKLIFVGLYYGGENHKIVPIELVRTEEELIKYLKDNKYITQ